MKNPVEIGRKKMKDKLIEDLTEVLDQATVDIGEGLDQCDVLGCIEWVKQSYWLQCTEDMED